MKSKKEINTLAKEVAELELKIKAAGMDKCVQLQMHRIETIMESLTLKEGLELNDAVLKILKNN